MNNFELRGANLNLLPALEALLETRSVTVAARRLHVTQSAMSHSLAKLRELLGDPLLVPAGRALVLSPRAAQLAEALPAALNQLERTLAPSQPFDPATSRRCFRVATLDYFEFVLIGDLLAHAREHAPGVEIWIERFTPTSLAALLAGELDLALVGEGSAARHPGITRRELFRDPFAVMLRDGHPALRKKTLTLESYLAHPHVVVTVEGRPDGAVDRALERLGARRTIALRVPHFATAPLAVLSSDAICTIASSVADRARALHPITLRRPPLELPAAGIVALWPKRAEADPGGRWFRELFLPGGALASRTGRRVRGA